MAPVHDRLRRAPIPVLEDAAENLPEAAAVEVAVGLGLGRPKDQKLDAMRAASKNPEIVYRWIELHVCASPYETIACSPDRSPALGGAAQKLDQRGPSFYAERAARGRCCSTEASTRRKCSLADLHCVDADTRRGLHGRKLVKQREAGTPWLARDAADVLACSTHPHLTL
jgi:hypothetical protein